MSLKPISLSFAMERLLHLTPNPSKRREDPRLWSFSLPTRRGLQSRYSTLLIAGASYLVRIWNACSGEEVWQLDCNNNEGDNTLPMFHLVRAAKTRRQASTHHPYAA